MKSCAVFVQIGYCVPESLLFETDMPPPLKDQLRIFEPKPVAVPLHVQSTIHNGTQLLVESIGEHISHILEFCVQLPAI